MEPTLAQELRARLRRWHDALRHTGHLSDVPRPVQSKRSSSCPHRDIGELSWLTSVGSLHPHSDPRLVSFRDCAEALVLLRALSFIDYTVYVGEVCQVWPDLRPPAATPDGVVDRTPGGCTVGLSYNVYSSGDLAPITERVFNAQAPSDEFLDDYTWLSGELVTYNGGSRFELRPSPIPVSITVNLRSDPLGFAYLIRQILQNALAQRLYAQNTQPEEGVHADAVTSTRFEIVEVTIGERSLPQANAEALECLARLVTLGIRIVHFPNIRDTNNLYSLDRLSVTKSLQTLLAPARDAAVPSSIKYVFVHDEAVEFTPAIFSAVQTSPTVRHVDIEVVSDSFDPRRQENVLRLWRWAAYAMFSSHAQHNVKTVTLSIDDLEAINLRAIEQVLHASNPLAALFATDYEDGRWIQASRFQLDDPRDPASDSKRTQFRSSNAMRVRVIDQSEFQGTEWWRVLLSGCGAAWVKYEDATEVPSSTLRDENASNLRCPLHFHLEGIVPSNAMATASLLRLIADRVGSIEVEAAATFDQAFDMTDWTLEVLRVCPHLHKLQLPWSAELPLLRPLVDAAHGGNLRLRALTLDDSFNVDTSDIIEFFDVLSDTEHPLTRKLEEIDLSVYDEGDSRVDFEAAWQRMLRHNRTLHTISLYLNSSRCVDTPQESVAIRTGPLSMARKLAFLSAIHSSNRPERPHHRLDTSVLAVIFRFAADHRLRKVLVNFQML